MMLFTVPPKHNVTLTQLHAAKELTKKWAWHPFYLYDGQEGDRLATA